MKKYSDSDILATIRSGSDGKIFEQLYVRIFYKVKSMIIKSGGDEEEARDIFQDAVLTFYKQVKLDKYKHNTEIDGYIYTVSRNAWYNRLKVKNRHTAIDETYNTKEDDSGTPESNYFDSEKSNHLYQALEKLGDRCKELLINTIYHGFSMQQVCEKMGFSSENAAKTKNYKCKQRLIKVVNENKELKSILQT